jgi:hypothetical protein
VPVAAIIALWEGRAAIHSAAVSVDGERVWALLAQREGGKSTTAALAVEAGAQLFTDDMLIVEGVRCFAGPASVDLRPESARRLGGEALGEIGERERWRKRVPATRLTAELAGFVELAWSEGGVTIEELGLADRLRILDEHISMPAAGEQVLALAGLPMLRLSRPHDLDAAAASVAQLLERLA